MLKKKLEIKYTPLALSLFYHNIDMTSHELFEAYVDDRSLSASDEFMKLTDKRPRMFESNAKTFPPLLFAEPKIYPCLEGCFWKEMLTSTK